jgi:nitrogen fixation/metabolism regulation signal transduction histidine kinase
MKTKQGKTLEAMYVETMIWWLFLVFAIAVGMNIYYAWKVIKAIMNFLGI